MSTRWICWYLDITPRSRKNPNYIYTIYVNFCFNQPLSIHCRRWPQHAFHITWWFWAYPSTLAQCGLEGVLYIIWYYMHMYCEGHPLNLSTLTLHRPQTSSHNWFSHIFFTHFCMYSIAVYRTVGNYCCCFSLLGGSAIRCQWCSLDPLGI